MGFVPLLSQIPVQPSLNPSHKRTATHASTSGSRALILAENLTALRFNEGTIQMKESLLTYKILRGEKKKPMCWLYTSPTSVLFSQAQSLLV